MPDRLRPLIEVDHPQLSVRRQCELLGLNRSSLYYEPTEETPEDLRLMGLTLGRTPVSEVARRLLPWMGFGFTIMVITGVMLFYAIPVRSYHSVWFRTKLILLVLAGLNAWLFHARIWRSVSNWDLDPVPPAAARAAGTASLVLWAGIIVTGRMIAYNWFDCDKPQPAAIVWAAGCNSYPK